ncbi:uncharacterized protein LOC135598226 [Musa acuminata AAA Group]|uniref:uncharacterized protein LOC135598226 n=1 Tax=Musa acuminata AAA Group TaxID=214697 RepID=UPI0031D97C55
MGAVPSRFWFLLFPANEYKNVVAGLENASQATTLYKLHLGEVVNTSPSIGSNVEEVVYKNIRFESWTKDVPVLKSLTRKELEKNSIEWRPLLIFAAVAPLFGVGKSSLPQAVDEQDAVVKTTSRSMGDLQFCEKLWIAVLLRDGMVERLWLRPKERRWKVPNGNGRSRRGSAAVVEGKKATAATRLMLPEFVASD